jgi:hypothetical protein
MGNQKVEWNVDRLKEYPWNISLGALQSASREGNLRVQVLWAILIMMPEVRQPTASQIKRFLSKPRTPIDKSLCSLERDGSLNKNQLGEYTISLRGYYEMQFFHILKVEKYLALSNTSHVQLAAHIRNMGDATIYSKFLNTYFD